MLLTGKHRKSTVLKLRQQWYSKLKNDGFEDIEHTHDDNGVSPYLKHTPSAINNRISYEEFIETQQYWSLCREFGWVNDWKRSEYFAVLWKSNREIEEIGWNINKMNKKQLKMAEKQSNLAAELWNLYSEGHSYRQIKQHTGIPLQQVFEIINIIKQHMQSWLSGKSPQKPLTSPEQAQVSGITDNTVSKNLETYEI